MLMALAIVATLLYALAQWAAFQPVAGIDPSYRKVALHRSCYDRAAGGHGHAG